MNSPPLSWQEDLVLGHEEIDRQHRDLVAAAGALQAAIAARAPVAKLQECCAALVECARNHFTTEEGLMLATGYPDYAAHRNEHQQLLKQLALIQQSLGAGNAGDLLLTVLNAWTIPHIRYADKNLAAFLERSDVVVPPASS
jgi:hemerythrin